MAFGGCGGLHACELAEALGIRTVIVPQHAGALSALGMLLADRVRDYAAAAIGRSDFERRFRELERQAGEDLSGAGLERFADLRYKGQSYELTVPWREDDPAAPFHRQHQSVYGYANPDRPVEVVTLRVRARLAVSRWRPRRPPRPRPANPARRRIHVGGAWRQTSVWRREEVPLRPVSGPALVIEYGATTLAPPGWRLRSDRAGNLLLER